MLRLLALFAALVYLFSPGESDPLPPGATPGGVRETRARVVDTYEAPRGAPAVRDATREDASRGRPAPPAPTTPEAVAVRAPGPESATSEAASDAAPAAASASPPAAPRGEGVRDSWTTESAAGAPSALDASAVPATIASDHHVEAVFLLDLTGSMGWIFPTAKEKALSLMKALEESRDEGRATRAAFVGYRDRSDSRPFETTDFSSNWRALRAKFEGLRATGGGDAPEDLQGALLKVLDELSWLAGDAGPVTRKVYLIGDAPAQRYPDQPGLEALGARLAARGITVHAFGAGASGGTARGTSAAARDFGQLATSTGGSFEKILATRGRRDSGPFARFHPPRPRPTRRTTPPGVAPERTDRVPAAPRPRDPGGDPDAPPGMELSF